MDLGKDFSEYKLDNHLNEVLAKLGFEKSTPIQEKAIPLIVSGQDVAGLAQTGTGKTAAFLLPLIERVLKADNPVGDEELDKRAFVDWKLNHFNLILVPTRELAEQVKNCALDFLTGTKHRVVVVYGGVSIEKQIEQLNQGFTFLVATPGRLIDLYKEHKVDLKQVRSVTFDEADRMFDMGFKDDMKFILRRIPEQRQFLLFSATLNLEVFNVAYQFGANPVEIKVSQDQMTADNVDDRIFHLGGPEKPPHLLGILDKVKPKQVIIFTNFKSQVERIAEFLNKNGHKAVGISSLLTQAQRQRVMNRFRAEEGENILVATDVAARGLDVEGVDLVINFEMPDDAENYVHRIGRTGRAGEKGKAFSFVSDKDVEALDRIQKYLNRTLESDWMNDTELPKEFADFPRGELIIKKSRTKNQFSDKGRDGRKGKRDFKDGDRKRRDGKDFKGNRDNKDNRNFKDNKDRENRDGNRDNSRDNNRDRKNFRRPESGDAEMDNKNVHRDKRSGRHKHKDGDSKHKKQHRHQASSNGNSQSNGSGNGEHRKSHHRKRHRDFPKKVTPVEKPEKKTVLTRISKALKGLFG